MQANKKVKCSTFSWLQLMALNVGVCFSCWGAIQFLPLSFYFKEHLMLCIEDIIKENFSHLQDVCGLWLFMKTSGG